MRVYILTPLRACGASKSLAKCMNEAPGTRTLHFQTFWGEIWPNNCLGTYLWCCLSRLGNPGSATDFMNLKSPHRMLKDLTINVPHFQLFLDLCKSVLGHVVSLAGLVLGKRLLRIRNRHHL